MATSFILIGPDVQIQKHLYACGDVVPAVDQAAVQRQGGILWPTTDAVVSTLAQLASQRLRGSGRTKLASQILAACLYSLAGGSGGPLLGPAGVTGNIAGVFQKATVTIAAAQCTAAATTQAFNLSPVLPINSRIIGRTIRLTGTFTGTTTATLSIGTATTPALIVNGQDIKTSSGSFAGPTGSDVGGGALLAGGTLQALVTTTGGNVSALAGSGGSVTCDVVFCVLT